MLEFIPSIGELVIPELLYVLVTLMVWKILCSIVSMLVALQNHTLLKLTLHSSGQAIGQGLFYTNMTSKRSGILLILCIQNDDWILKRFESVNKHMEAKW